MALVSMASICNYTHHELQNTDGLVPQNRGDLFPYNPEFYERASGLYGPGSVYCWYLLMVSCALNSRTERPRSSNDVQKKGISNDLLAIIAYPVFAATDALVQAVRLIGARDRALVVFCITNTLHDLTGFGEFPQEQLHLSEIPDDVLDLGQRAVDLTGPLHICQAFGVLVFFLLGVLFREDSLPSGPMEAAIVLSLLYPGVALIAIYISLGNADIAFSLAIYGAMQPIVLFLTLGGGLMVTIEFCMFVVKLTMSIRQQDIRGRKIGCKGIVICIGQFCFVPVGGICLSRWALFRFVPDLGIALGERDQMATLIVGAVSLAFTIYDAWIRWKQERAPTMIALWDKVDIVLCKIIDEFEKDENTNGRSDLYTLAW
jgi:hypothetical protein